ncbi:hypothetical protein BDP27DRAFT_1067415 [Rhodocollybia butyracea]|uniref:Uncharacterized protein n=1 Tax=Rhodocollybia butyracea TaxID=206335 RepID=A0A9P5U3M7_9AGAR|nr:hypothetical protein BDP27DRAFT_1067415 [Rhodocollybia butyracea]
MQPKVVCLCLLAMLMFTGTGCALPHNLRRSPAGPSAPQNANLQSPVASTEGQAKANNQDIGVIERPEGKAGVNFNLQVAVRLNSDEHDKLTYDRFRVSHICCFALMLNLSLLQYSRSTSVTRRIGPALTLPNVSRSKIPMLLTSSVSR